MSKTSNAARSAADTEGKEINEQSEDNTESKPQSAKQKAQAAGKTGKAAGTGGGQRGESSAEQDAETPDAPQATGGDETSEDAEAARAKELAAERDKYLRLAAEYDNFRKRSAKERETTYSEARIDTITRLLPVYDNLERALKMECADEAFYKGIEMTMTKLTEILEGMNVKRIPALGEPFDPNRHNAVLSIEDPNLGEKIIAEECSKGFMLGDRVIRFSTVVVAN